MYTLEHKPDNVVACIDFNINNSNIESFGLLLRHFDDRMLDITQRHSIFVNIIPDSETENRKNSILNMHKSTAMNLLLHTIQFAGVIVIRSADDWPKIKNNILYVANDETLNEIENIISEGYNELFPLRKYLLTIPSFTEYAKILYPGVDINFLSISEMYQALFGYQYVSKKITELDETDMLGDMFNYLLNYCRESVISDWLSTQELNPQVKIDLEYYSKLEEEEQNFKKSITYRCYLLARHYNDLLMLNKYRNREYDELIELYKDEVEMRENANMMPGAENIGEWEMNQEQILKNWQRVTDSNTQFLKKFDETVKVSKKSKTGKSKITKK